LGAPGDLESLEQVRPLFAPATLDLVGKAGIRVTMALLRRVALFVGNDSGIMHLAAAAGIPLVALFGPQSPARFGPWSERARYVYKGFPCSPCRQKFFTECDPSSRMKPPCVEAITVEEVIRECRTLLKVKSDR